MNRNLKNRNIMTKTQFVILKTYVRYTYTSVQMLKLQPLDTCTFPESGKFREKNRVRSWGFHVQQIMSLATVLSLLTSGISHTTQKHAHRNTNRNLCSCCIRTIAQTEMNARVSYAPRVVVKSSGAV